MATLARHLATATKMSGWVKMKKKKAFTQWRQRFISLDGPVLTYYDTYNPSKTQNQHRGKIFLEKGKTKVLSGKDGILSIETNSGKSTYSFQIANDARAAWIEALNVNMMETSLLLKLHPNFELSSTKAERAKMKKASKHARRGSVVAAVATVPRFTCLKIEDSQVEHFREKNLPDFSSVFGGSINTAMKKLNAGLVLPESGVLCRSARASNEAGRDVFYFLSTETSNKDKGNASLFSQSRGLIGGSHGQRMIWTQQLQELMAEWDVADESAIDGIYKEKQNAYNSELARDDGTEVRRAAREGLAAFVKDLELMQILRTKLRANRKTEDTPEVETDTANVLSEITGTSLKYAQDFLDKAGGDARTAAKELLMRKEQLAEDLEREKEKLRLQLESANVLPVDDDAGHERTASEAYVPVKCADMEGSSDMQLRNASVMLLESVLDEVETSEDEPRAQRADSVYQERMDAIRLARAEKQSQAAALKGQKRMQMSLEAAALSDIIKAAETHKLNIARYNKERQDMQMESIPEVGEGVPPTPHKPAQKLSKITGLSQEVCGAVLEHAENDLQSALRKVTSLPPDVLQQLEKQVEIKASKEDISDLLDGVTRVRFKIAPDFPNCAEKSLMHIHQHMALVHLNLRKRDRGESTAKEMEETHAGLGLMSKEQVEAEFDFLQTRFKLERLHGMHQLPTLQDLCGPTWLDNVTKSIEKIHEVLETIRPLDVELVVDLVQKAEVTTQSVVGKDIILLLGGTGVGKSTTVQFLSGCKMERSGLKHIGPAWPLVLTSGKPHPPATREALRDVVSKDVMESVTKAIVAVPVQYRSIGIEQDGEFVLVDTPGFGDTAGAEVDISNSIGIVKAVHKARSVKPVVFVSQMFFGERGGGMTKLIDTLANFIGDVKRTKDSIHWLFTKYPIESKFSINETLRSVMRANRDKEHWHAAAVELLQDAIDKTEKPQGALIVLPLDPPAGHEPAAVVEGLRNRDGVVNPRDVFRHFATPFARHALRSQILNLESAVVSAMQRVTEQFPESQRNYITGRGEADLALYKLSQLSVLATHINEKALFNHCLDEVKRIIRGDLDRAFKVLAHTFDHSKASGIEDAMQQLLRVMRHAPIQQKFFADSDDLTDLQDSCFTQLLQRMRVLSEIVENAVGTSASPTTEDTTQDETAAGEEKEDPSARVEELSALKQKREAEFKAALAEAEEAPELNLAQELQYAEEDYNVFVSRGQTDTKRGVTAKERVDGIKSLLAKQNEIAAIDAELENARELLGEAAAAASEAAGASKLAATWATPVVFETLEKLRLIAQTKWEVTTISTERLNAEYQQTLQLLKQSTLSIAQKAREVADAKKDFNVYFELVTSVEEIFSNCTDAFRAAFSEEEQAQLHNLGQYLLDSIVKMDVAGLIENLEQAALGKCDIDSARVVSAVLDLESALSAHPPPKLRSALRAELRKISTAFYDAANAKVTTVIKKDGRLQAGVDLHTLRPLLDTIESLTLGAKCYSLYTHVISAIRSHVANQVLCFEDLVRSRNVTGSIFIADLLASLGELLVAFSEKTLGSAVASIQHTQSEALAYANGLISSLRSDLSDHANVEAIGQRSAVLVGPNKIDTGTFPEFAATCSSFYEQFAFAMQAALIAEAQLEEGNPEDWWGGLKYAATCVEFVSVVENKQVSATAARDFSEVRTRSKALEEKIRAQVVDFCERNSALFESNGAKLLQLMKGCIPGVSSWLVARGLGAFKNKFAEYGATDVNMLEFVEESDLKDFGLSSDQIDAFYGRQTTFGDSAAVADVDDTSFDDWLAIRGLGVFKSQLAELGATSTEFIELLTEEDLFGLGMNVDQVASFFGCTPEADTAVGTLVESDEFAVTNAISRQWLKEQVSRTTRIVSRCLDEIDSLPQDDVKRFASFFPVHVTESKASDVKTWFKKMWRLKLDTLVKESFLVDETRKPTLDQLVVQRIVLQELQSLDQPVTFGKLEVPISHLVDLIIKLIDQLDKDFSAECDNATSSLNLEQITRCLIKAKHIGQVPLLSTMLADRLVEEHVFREKQLRGEFMAISAIVEDAKQLRAHRPLFEGGVMFVQGQEPALNLQWPDVEHTEAKGVWTLPDGNEFVPFLSGDSRRNVQRRHQTAYEALLVQINSHAQIATEQIQIQPIGEYGEAALPIVQLFGLVALLPDNLRANASALVLGLVETMENSIKEILASYTPQLQFGWSVNVPDLNALHALGLKETAIVLVTSPSYKGVYFVKASAHLCLQIDLEEEQRTQLFEGLGFSDFDSDFDLVDATPEVLQSLQDILGWKPCLLDLNRLRRCSPQVLCERIKRAVRHGTKDVPLAALQKYVKLVETIITEQLQSLIAFPTQEPRDMNEILTTVKGVLDRCVPAHWESAAQIETALRALGKRIKEMQDTRKREEDALRENQDIPSRLAKMKAHAELGIAAVTLREAQDQHTRAMRWKEGVASLIRKAVNGFSAEIKSYSTEAVPEFLQRLLQAGDEWATFKSELANLHQRTKGKTERLPRTKVVADGREDAQIVFYESDVWAADVEPLLHKIGSKVSDLIGEHLVLSAVALQPARVARVGAALALGSAFLQQLKVSQSTNRNVAVLVDGIATVSPAGAPGALVRTIAQQVTRCAEVVADVQQSLTALIPPFKNADGPTIAEQLDTLKALDGLVGDILQFVEQHGSQVPQDLAGPLKQAVEGLRRYDAVQEELLKAARQWRTEICTKFSGQEAVDSPNAEDRNAFYAGLNRKYLVVKDPLVLAKHVDVDAIAQDCKAHFRAEVLNFKQLAMRYVEQITDIEALAPDSSYRKFNATYDNFRAIQEHIDDASVKAEARQAIQDVDEVVAIKLEKLRSQALKHKSATSIAKSLVQLKKLSFNAPYLGERVESIISDGILSVFAKQRGGFETVMQVGQALQGWTGDDARYAKMLIHDTPAFAVIKTYMRNAGTQKFDVETVLGLREQDGISGNFPDPTEQRCTDALLACFKDFEKEYWGLVEEALKHSQPKSFKSVYADKARTMARRLRPKRDSTVLFKPAAIISIMAHVFAFWTLDMLSDMYKTVADDVSKTAGQKRNYLTKPHAGQVISIFRLFGLDMDSRDGPRLKNHLVEIFTGEGKSITLGVCAVLLALMGYGVDCACYSVYLSNRDFESFKNIFEEFGVLQHIQYGTFNQLCEDTINSNSDIREMVQKLVGVKATHTSSDTNRLSRPRALLIDEVDVFFSKDFYGNTYSPLASLRDPTISDLIRFAWDIRKGKDRYQKILGSDAFAACCAKFEGWESLFKAAAHDMVDALQNLKNHTYVVQEQKIGYPEQDGVSFNKSFGFLTVFAYMKERSRKAPTVTEAAVQKRLAIEVCCGSFSYAEVPKSYSFIMGVTGTLGALANKQRTQLELEYNIKKSTHMPSVFGANQCKFAAETAEFVNLVEPASFFTEINNMTQNPPATSSSASASDRAVLVFFENKKVLEQFRAHPCFANMRSFARIMTEETPTKDKKDLINSAASKGNVTLLTRAYGRGTDFVCYDDALDDAGGVHVIQTFVSDLKSEEIQIKGRTARQGKKGSFSLVLKIPSLEPYLGPDFAQQVKDNRARGRYYSFIDTARTKYYDSIYPTLLENVHSILEEHTSSMQFVQDLVAGSTDKARRKAARQFVLTWNPAPPEPIMGVTVQAVSRTLVLMDATGSMRPLLQAAKATVGKMYLDTNRVLKGKARKKFQLQFAAYSNYNVGKISILRASPWCHKASGLRKFMQGINTRGGLGNEAIEIGLLHANWEHEANPIGQVILIGDAPPNTPREVKKNRKRKGEHYWYNTKYRDATTSEAELAKLKANGIPVHTFYLAEDAKKAFMHIAEETGGRCQELDVNTEGGSQKLQEVITTRVLHNIGGEEYVKEYEAMLAKRKERGGHVLLSPR